MIAFGIGGLAVLVSIVIAFLYRRVSFPAGAMATLVLMLLLTIQWRVAASGAVHRWHDTPPPLAPLVVVALLVASAGSLLPIGRKFLDVTPLAVIVGLQGFRLPLELFMHQAAVTGVMPMQMSFSGWNFDIVTGATAIIVSFLIATGRASRALVIGWNALGSILLVTIMTIGVSSTPTFGAFGPDHLNTFVADVPFVWLPGILVPAAFWGHVLVWRALVSGYRGLGESGYRKRGLAG